MKQIQLFNVAPSLPHELEFLETLYHNAWWCWNSHAIELFRRIDPQLWKDAAHNPFVFFSRIPQERLEALVEDKGFMSHYRQVEKRFRKEILQDQEDISSKCIAYFSLEYGIHESLRLYSGGLGCLSGDHLKSASDLKLPLVAVGLFYRCGYFQQYLNNDGWQQEACVENEIHYLPLKKALDKNGNTVQVSIPLPDGTLRADIWQIDVGRVPLFLLDSNIVDNKPEHRNICTHLYDSDRQTRLRQELLLGIGGYRALLALGYDPPACHINEGHAAFMTLERIAHLVKNKGLTQDEAWEIVRRTNIFTTHTPVPAGNESFSIDLIESHLAALQKETGIDPEQLISWGRAPDSTEENSPLVMTILALRTSLFANGVSKLHGEVSRKMWSHLWPGRPHDEIPISHITNGVHVSSWISTDNAALFDKYLGSEWRNRIPDMAMLERIDNIPDEELWRAHELGRSRLVRAARELGESQLSARNATRTEIDQIKSILHHDALTIGFARRFASYKRATLILQDMERLEKILTDEEKPVQIVFAGKAHPADDTGKSFIQEIIRFAHRSDIRNKLIFLENYDIQVARYLVQGVDVWLNNPRRPQEASGTSGMKATVNGAIHLSILDGWWDEGYDPECGWAIGHGEEYDNWEYQDATESQALYNTLEDEVIPLFYNRPDGDIPSGWIKMMKASMKMMLSRFTTTRMLAEYDELMYQPALKENWLLWENDRQRMKALAERHKKLNSLWKTIKLSTPQTDREISELHVGDKFEVTTLVDLGKLSPEEVDIEVYYGPVNGANEIIESNPQKMMLSGEKQNGRFLYKQVVNCETTGRYGLTARATPSGTGWKRNIPGFITWADES